MSIKTNLGAVTAYADAVAAGYTGTREQWAEDMAKLGENVAEVREAVTAANTAKDGAEAARDETNRLAEDAVTEVGDARDVAVAAVNEAADARIEEIKQAGSTSTDVGAVRFDEAQELTEAQQGQARDNISASGAIVTTASGDGAVVVNDSAAAALRGLRIFGRSTQDGTPSPDAPVPIVSVGDKGTIGVTIVEAGRELTHATPNGLPGIPVTSGGNYTDVSGQQWVCDEVDFGRGVYISRVWSVILNGIYGADGRLNVAVYPSNNGFIFTGVLPEIMGARRGFSTHFPVAITSATTIESILIGSSTTNLYMLNSQFYDAALSDSGISNLSEWINDNPVTTMGQYNTPIETPLTEDELAAYKALCTQYPTTTIASDEDAGIEVSYVADTKTYIDNKFAELSAAIVNA